MSILPNQDQGSISSSSSLTPSVNPNSKHGDRRPNFHSQSPPAPSRQILTFGSLQISDSQSSFSMVSTTSGPSARAAEDSGGSSQEVTESRIPGGKKALPNNHETNLECHSGGGGRGFGSAQSRGDHEIHSEFHAGGGGRGSRSDRSRGKRSGTIGPRSSQQTTRSVASHGSSMQPAGRKAQIMNGNHLLNFQYEPISRRPQPRAAPPPPPGRHQKRKPYNKDLFLQANYKFVVLDSGNYSAESMDPDKMLQWEDIICVRYSTPNLVQCPICLEYPLCPQITSCGHIFCFPCILQYLLMGKEDHKGDCWKRCPLCFVMISPKDLYTLFVENVKQYCVGDTIELMLLTRQKDSFTLSHKSKQEKDSIPGGDDENYDPFSKFTFTSDVDLSVRKAISELDGWLVRAESGLVDDLEKLPYVCAAMEQLEQRKKYWNEHRAMDGNKSCIDTDGNTGSFAISSTENATNVNHEPSTFGNAIPSNDVCDHNKGADNLVVDKSDDGTCSDQSVDAPESLEGYETVLSSSYDASKITQGHLHSPESVKDKDSYNFYQAADGQHIIIHPLNMKCLLHHYGSHDMLPHRISGKILELETVSQTEAMRRRYRYLSHFSLTTILQFCEIDLSELLSPDALSPFMEDIKKREKQRKQLARKELKEKMKAESAMAYSIPIVAGYERSFHDGSPTFSMDDFEALGSSTVTSSSSPVVGERKLFSSVTRLGFAAGHDSPTLKLEGTNSVNDNDATTYPPGTNGAQNAGVTSFANIISRPKPGENLDAPKMNDSGKKGKKPSRVLLSTAGGRRY